MKRTMGSIFRKTKNGTYAHHSWTQFSSHKGRTRLQLEGGATRLTSRPPFVHPRRATLPCREWYSRPWIRGSWCTDGKPKNTSHPEQLVISAFISDPVSLNVLGRLYEVTVLRYRNHSPTRALVRGNRSPGEGRHRQGVLSCRGLGKSHNWERLYNPSGRKVIPEPDLLHRLLVLACRNRYL